MVSILIILLLIGVMLWLLNTYLPVEDPIKKILNVIIIILALLWLAKVAHLI